MSAPETSTVTGGSAVAPEADAARLEQPTDAVPMETIPQSQSNPSPADDAKKEPASTDSEPSSSAAAPGAPEQSADAAAEAKGKSKDEMASTAPPPLLKDRSDSIMAIGPAQDDITSMTPGGIDGPVCNITLLLTTGSRHPYKIDSKYLGRRNVPIPEETESGMPDPFSISIYTLKELILREWRSDWEAKPASPSSIRLIHFGKLLDDKEQLKSRLILLGPRLTDYRG